MPAVVDFGAVPWGQRVTRDLVVGVEGFPRPVHVLDFRADCSCITAELFARARGEALRPLTDVPFAQRLLADGEVPILRVSIDATEKPVADEAVSLHESALLVSVGDGDALHDVELPVSLRFGIESDVRLLPAPHFEFGDVRRGSERTLRIGLVAKDAVKTMAFGEPKSDDPRVRCSLAHGPDAPELVATLRVGKGDGVGLIAGRIELPSAPNVPALRIPFSARVVGGMEASVSNVNLGVFDPAVENPECTFSVVDHDSDQAPDLRVLRFEDTTGEQVAERIDVIFSAQAAPALATTVRLVWKGDLGSGSLRGELVLSKKGHDDAFVQIGIAAFPRCAQNSAR